MKRKTIKILLAVLLCGLCLQGCTVVRMSGLSNNRKKSQTDKIPQTTVFLSSFDKWAANAKPGLYKKNRKMYMTWDELISNGMMTVSGNELIKYQSQLKEDNDNENILVIDDGITVIGDDAFSAAEEDVDWSYPFFSNQNHLRHIWLPDNIEKIGQNAFAGSKTLEEIKIPEKVKEINARTFMKCIKLEKVTFSESLKSIDDSAFEYCETLTSIEIPDSLETLSGSAFDYSGLEELNIKNATIVPNRTSLFSNFSCMSNLEKFTASKGLPSNVDGILVQCDKINEIKIPNGTKEITDASFARNEALQKVTLPDTLEKIGNLSFGSNISLEEINIPDSVKEIGIGAFEFCPKLNKIHYRGNTYTKEEFVKAAQEYIKIDESAFQESLSTEALARFHDAYVAKHPKENAQN